MIRHFLVATLFVLQMAPEPAAPAPPPIEQARLLATYPHDTSAFTEGLLIHRGQLYESTGREGQSDIRRVDLRSGRVRARVRIPSTLFGEGIVAWHDNLFSVTWHGGRGFRWTLPALKRSGSFRYAGEGWAMTDDGRNLILSDGTPILRFLDPVTQNVIRRLTVTIEGRPLDRLNELEYVKGELLANVWMTRYIVRIDPDTGKVKGIIDLTPMLTKVALTDRDSVANGIAYDRDADRLYVTGKNWPKLFEIARPRQDAQ